MSFFQRIANYVTNEFLVEGLANKCAWPTPLPSLKI